MKNGNVINVLGGVVFPSVIKDFLSQGKFFQFFVLTMWGKKVPPEAIELVFDRAFQNNGFPTKLYLNLVAFVASQREKQGFRINIPLPETEQVGVFYGVVPEGIVEPPEEPVTPEISQKLIEQTCKFLGENPGLEGAFAIANLYFEKDKAAIVWEEAPLDMTSFVERHPAWQRAAKIWGQPKRSK